MCKFVKIIKNTHFLFFFSSHNIYLSEHEYGKQKIVINLQSEEESCQCYFSEDLCGEGVNEFSYIKIRPFDVLRNTYLKQQTEQTYFNKESLLFGKQEKFDNSMDYLRLFCFVAESYRGIYDTNEYAERLFRLFFFLFPYTGIKVMEQNMKEYGEIREFAEYNKQILQDYENLGKGKQGENTMSPPKISITIEQLKSFCGFDFWNIYKSYESSGWESQSLKDILKKQMSICGKLSRRTNRMQTVFVEAAHLQEKKDESEKEAKQYSYEGED